MFVEGKSRTIFFPSNTLIYGIFRDGSKNINNIRTCEHLILGQLRMGARQAKNAPLDQACTRITRLVGCSVGFTMPKMAHYAERALMITSKGETLLRPDQTRDEG